MSSMKKMSLVGFMQAGNATVYAGSWRHPATEHGFLTASYYEKLGRTLEEGCFDMMFFDDRLAMPGIFGGSVAEAVRHGARPVKLDLSIVLGILAATTRSIGLGATYSTTYYSPFHVARTFATLDHLTGGRAAWNVVTSVNDSEAQNFGVDQVLAHDQRYDRADEFLEAVAALWDSWEDDALVLDRVNGVFADPDKVHELDFKGEWFKVRGPLTVPRSPQGRPVLLQAGSSGRGRDFAARWAELIFTGDPGIEVARSHYKDQKEKLAEVGRDPSTVKMLPMAYTVVGESTAHAQEREQRLPRRLCRPDGLADPAVRADEPRLLGHEPRRAHHRRAHRVGVGHPRARAEPAHPHRRRHHPGRPGRASRHAAAGPPLRRHRPRRGRPDAGVVRHRRLRRLRHRGHPFARRLRGRGATRRARAAEAGGVPRPLRRAPRCARTSGSSGPSASPMADGAGPLQGLRVIDAATLVAGPLAATNLGEFGAEVIKVEQPGSGDPLRTWGDRKDGIGLAWKSVSRNKRCVTLDLRQVEGQELFHQLLDVSDVLVVGNRPSALERWGLDYESVHERHPQLVMVHISGYGRGGPSSDRPGYGTLAEAMSGFAQVTGEPDGPPTLPPFMLADGVAAQAATWAVMMALYHRDVTGGGGQLIDVNLIEPLARLIETSTLAFDQLGVIPGRVGNRLPASAPRNAYRTSDDKYLAISSASPTIAVRVFRTIGRDDLADDPDYVDPVRRQAHGDEVDDLVAAWVRARTLDEAMKLFLDAEVAAAPVYDAEQLLNDEHLAARGTFLRVDDPDLGPVRVQGPVALMTDTPGRVDHLGGSLGADNDAVYGDLLGLAPERLAALRAAGVI